MNEWSIVCKLVSQEIVCVARLDNCTHCIWFHSSLLSSCGRVAPCALSAVLISWEYWSMIKINLFIQALAWIPPALWIPWIWRRRKLHCPPHVCSNQSSFLTVPTPPPSAWVQSSQTPFSSAGSWDYRGSTVSLKLTASLIFIKQISCWDA